MKTLSLTLLALFTVSIMSVQGQLIAYEGFDYDSTGTPSLNGANGGTGDWNGAWTLAPIGNPQNTSGNDYQVIDAASNPTPGIETTGNRIQKSGTGPGTGTIYNRSLLTQSFSDGDTLWFSFNFDGSLDSGFQNGVSFNNGSDAVLTIGNNPTETTPNRNLINVLDDSGTRFTQSSVAFSGSFNFPSLIIGKIDFQSGDELLDLYYATSITDEASLGSGASPAVFTNLAIDNIASFDGIQVFFNNSAAGQFDEFRLGTTFNSVIPEPTSAALLLGAAGLLALRRRRH